MKCTVKIIINIDFGISGYNILNTQGLKLLVVFENAQILCRGRKLANAEPIYKFLCVALS